MMKRMGRSQLGVTLLEIMLVLAIAAMVIVMSVRYYQSANASRQANDVMQQIMAITAAADGLSQASGSYAAVTSAAVGPLLPANGLRVPWSTGTITLTPNTAYLGLSIPAVPAAVCPLLRAKLVADAHFGNAAPPAACTGTAAAMAIRYTPNP